MRGKTSIPIGLLFSSTGPYSELGAQGRAGAMAAVAAVNADDRFDFRFEPVAADPGGNTDRYAGLASDLVTGSGVRHIVGCTTSWSRKEVIPVLEKTGAVLWYPCVYEGFEANEHVVYAGACANQHVLPLLDFALSSFGPRAYLVGSNYIWGWETCRIARDVVTRSGGTVLGERHVPLGDTDIGRLIEEIRLKRPDFVLNNLIGPSSYAFLAAYRALADDDDAFDPARRPVLSCNLSENEIARLARAAEGHLTTATYFEALETDENIAFRASLAGMGGTAISAFFAQAYTSVRLIAEGMGAVGACRPLDLVNAVSDLDLASPIGTIRIDPLTHHIHAFAHIARARADGRYEIVVEGVDRIAPDPFMTRADLVVGRRRHQANHGGGEAARLRVVQ